MSRAMTVPDSCLEVAPGRCIAWVSGLGYIHSKNRVARVRFSCFDVGISITNGWGVSSGVPVTPELTPDVRNFRGSNVVR